MRPIVFAITGTNGKTTTSYMLGSILKSAGFSYGIVGTIKHIIGDKTYKSINTTPGKETFKQYMEELEAQDIPYLITEASSHGLVQGRLDEVHIDYAGFTNLTEDHLDYHGDMETYYAAKKSLFEKDIRAGVITIDDKYGLGIFDELKGSCNLYSLSMKNPSANFYGKISSINFERTLISFAYEKNVSRMSVVREKNSSMDLSVSPPGPHFAADGVLAAGLALSAGIGAEHCVKGLADAENIAGRWEVVKPPKGTVGIVDFAHTPDALEKTLTTAKKICGGNLVCVFGCGGDRDKDKRYMMGFLAGRIADLTIITADNSRGEKTEDIMAEIERGTFASEGKYLLEPDRKKAIKLAVLLTRPGDVIIVAGKGHEKYQAEGDRLVEFSDIAVLQGYLHDKYD